MTRDLEEESGELTGNTNHLRSFADVVTLHPWQKPGDEEGCWEIYADVSFQTARIGGEPHIPVRFRLSLKRAKITLLLPQTDQHLSLDPMSIARDDGGRGSVKVSSTNERTKERSASGEVSFGLSKVISILTFGVSTKLARSFSQRTKTLAEMEAEQFSITVTGRSEASKRASWIVEATHADRLSNAPWDPKKARAVMRDANHHDRRPGMEAGGLKFVVTCAREDLIIEDFEFKDEGDNAAWFGNRSRVKEEAITQYIKKELMEKGLHAGNVADRYGEMTILDRLIEN